MWQRTVNSSHCHFQSKQNGWNSVLCWLLSHFFLFPVFGPLQVHLVYSFIKSHFVPRSGQGCTLLGHPWVADKEWLTFRWLGMNKVSSRSPNKRPFTICVSVSDMVCFFLENLLPEKYHKDRSAALWSGDWYLSTKWGHCPLSCYTDPARLFRTGVWTEPEWPWGFAYRTWFLKGWSCILDQKGRIVERVTE